MPAEKNGMYGKELRVGSGYALFAEDQGDKKIEGNQKDYDGNDKE